MKKSVKSILTIALMGAIGMASASTVFTWKGQSGNAVYSDTPRNLTTHNISTMNVRSQTVSKVDSGVSGNPVGGQIGTTAPAGSDASLADQQAALNAKLAQENKRQEEENKKVEEQNKQMRAQNCTSAKMNLQNVQTSNRVNNREALVAGYQADIQKFCN